MLQTTQKHLWIERNMVACLSRGRIYPSARQLSWLKRGKWPWWNTLGQHISRLEFGYVCMYNRIHLCAPFTLVDNCDSCLIWTVWSPIGRSEWHAWWNRGGKAILSVSCQPRTTGATACNPIGFVSLPSSCIVTSNWHNCHYRTLCCFVRPSSRTITDKTTNPLLLHTFVLQGMRMIESPSLSILTLVHDIYRINSHANHIIMCRTHLCSGRDDFSKARASFCLQCRTKCMDRKGNRGLHLATVDPRRQTCSHLHEKR